MLKIKILLILAIISFIGVSVYRQHSSAVPAAGKTESSIRKTASTDEKPALRAVKPSACAANSLNQEIIVSISQQHLWACDGTVQAYDSAVITGMENVPADLTPVGTYQVYGKQTNHTLQGCDPISCWNDFVYYWMPFLSNQYGVYGFHDATWRKAGDFGSISPYSNNASRGCVETPLATAKWLYDWAPNGTKVSIVS